MSKFDPYHRWLGIPPKEQPPSYYRLLAIAEFEDDPDVIENAADRQMAHVRTHQRGKYADLSQRLLNELAEARVCLLHAQRKAAYDCQLRAKRQKASPPARVTSAQPREARRPQVVRAVAAPTAQPVSAAPSPQVPAQVSGADSPTAAIVTGGATRRRYSRSRSPLPAVVGSGILAALGLVLLLVWMNSGEDPVDVPAQAARTATSPSGPAVPKPPANTTPKSANTTPKADGTAQAKDDPDKTNQATVPPLDTEPDGGEELAALLARAQTALIEKRVEEGIEALEQYLAEPAPPERDRARQLLEHAQLAISEARALEILRKFTDPQLDRIAEGKSVVNLKGLAFDPPALKDVFDDTLRRMVPRAKELLAASTAQDDPPMTPTAAGESAGPIGDPEEFLESLGLSQQGNTWLLSGEREIGRRQLSLTRLTRDFLAAEQAKAEAFQKVAVYRKRYAAAKEQFDKLVTAKASPPPDLTDFVQDWRRKFETRGGIAEIPEVQRVMRRLAAARHALTLAVVREKPFLDGLQERYQQLADDPRVSEALSKVDSPARQRLGPSSTLARVQSRLDQCAAKVLTDKVPLTREDGRAHANVIINEKGAASLCYLSLQNDFRDEVPGLLPDRVLKAAGIDVKPPYDTTLRLRPETLQVKRITLPSIRVGKFLIENVEVYALPPESNHFGTLGDAAFRGYRANVNYDELYFQLTPF